MNIDYYYELGVKFLKDSIGLTLFGICVGVFLIAFLPFLFFIAFVGWLVSKFGYEKQELSRDD